MVSIDELFLEYGRRITEILNEIERLDLEKEGEYYASLSAMEGFSKAFGYDDNGDNGSCDVSHLVSLEEPFSIVLGNICYRRAYFYLDKLRGVLSDNGEEHPQVSKLVDYFDGYRRTKKAYRDGHLDEVLMSALNSEKPYPYSLAPFYETFVDPELFTALLLLRRSNLKVELRVKLIGRLEYLLRSYIKENGNLQESELFHRYVMDEANIYWGLKELYEARGSGFRLGDSHVGKEGFERLYLRALERMTNYGARSPIPDDLIFEITPEINTRERTRLYVLFNSLELLLGNYDLSDSFRSALRGDVEKLIRAGIMNVPSAPENLYFLCLQWQCLQRYLYLQEEKSDHETTIEQKDGAASGRFAVAISFAGEQRNYVRKIAAGLADTFTEESIFFDEFHQAKIIKVGAARDLDKIYGSLSDLVVPFFSKEYVETVWPGHVECRAIIELISNGQDWKVMPFTFDGVKPPEFKNAQDIVAKVGDFTPEDIVKLIIERCEHNQLEHPPA